MSVDDELSARAMLADLTAGQPPAPPDRYGSIRRRAVVHRRRQYAAIAAVIAVLAVAAVTIPLGLRTLAPPAAPGAYHLTERTPRTGHGNLEATGTVDGEYWSFLLRRDSGHASSPGGSGICVFALANGLICAGGPVPVASRAGPPVSIALGSTSRTTELDAATVRSDVTAVVVRYTNGQSLTLRPLLVFGRGTARYVVLVSPHPSSVVSVTAFAGDRDLGYAVPAPFGPPRDLSLVRWLRAGQPPWPRPVTRVIGAGELGGSAWGVTAAIGPWGTCLYTPAGLDDCWASTRPDLPAGTDIYPRGGMASSGDTVQFYSGQAAPQVSYLTVTTKDGRTSRVPVVTVGSLRFYACADVRGNRIVRWAAYDAAGQRLVSSKPGQVP